MAQEIKPAVTIKKVGGDVKAPAKKEAPKPVVGVTQNLVRLHYKKENTHMLSHVHAIVQGVNHVPEGVWAEAKKHPANAAMLKAGDIVDLDNQSDITGESEKTDKDEASEDEESA